ncbi:MAG: ketoacyl-ACP synthase III, partial [Acidobacteriia bacterium]|nr:ketoacyl-ACP synthase III [Terriglobia bacterium]
MATSRFQNLRIAGIATSVPGPSRPVAETAGIPADAAAKVSASTGVSRRHTVADNVCTSDLCRHAAENLLLETGWDKTSIDALIFVSQTPDYFLPATACSLHGKLNLPVTCAAFDVNLGCSGYVYGLWLASMMITSGMKRVILLAGDTISRIASPVDKSVALLFGDAGSATAIEASPNGRSWWFELGTDGSGANHLIVPAGGFRKPADEQTQRPSEREGGNIRSDENLYMDGGEIFAFTLARVPKLCRSVMEAAGWEMDDVTRFIMHQANRFMLRHLSRQMTIPEARFVVALEEYGNTSSASIPMAMSTSMGSVLQEPARL